jgi:SAM-dependent methyltransferase
MPSLEDNRRIWTEEHDWPQSGDEWSGPWAGSDAQWHECIFPRIRSFIPVDHILEIAPGHGRWTQFLQAHARRLSIVDLSPACIAACRDRFRHLGHLEYHVNDGRSLDMIGDESVDFVFSFDSLVHADPDTLRAYIQQIARKLRRGGAAFIHHSNLGAFKHWLFAKRIVVTLCQGSSRLGNLLIHDCFRDRDMTAALMRRYGEEAGLACISQEIVPWIHSRRPIDCFTSLRRNPHDAQKRPPDILILWTQHTCMGLLRENLASFDPARTFCFHRPKSAAARSAKLAAAAVS